MRGDIDLDEFGLGVRGAKAKPREDARDARGGVDHRAQDEREFYEERSEQKRHTLVCPHCNQPGEHELSWTVRQKRKQAPRGADEAALARFAKAQSYMVRRDDLAGCKNVRCRKRFEITMLQSVVILQDEATGTADERAARIRAAFGRRGRE